MVFQLKKKKGKGGLVTRGTRGEKWSFPLKEGKVLSVREATVWFSVEVCLYLGKEGKFFEFFWCYL